MFRMYCLLICVAGFHLAIAQFNYNEVVAPSPTASALGEYGNNPVSLYTGTPNITIPLGMIKGREISIPVNLSYMAHGVQVEENASWVGTGWSLNATGVITRTVRGLEDRTDISNRVQFPLPSDVTAMKNLLLSVHLQLVDPEPDIYFFNFPGYSGSFVLDQNGEVILGDIKNIRIKKDPGLFAKFTITIDNGTQYIFESAENTTFFGATTPSSNSALYLTKIISPTGKETIDFVYATEVSKFFSLPRPRKWARPTNIVRSETITSPFGRTEVTGKRLERIVSNFGQNIEFVANNIARQDLASVTASIAPKALKEIKFYNQDNIVYKRFAFAYETIETTIPYAPRAAADPPANLVGYANYRMYLKSVQELATDLSSTVPPHVFTYHGRNQFNKDLLPSKLSADQDHWGYYNGANNNDLLPGYSGPFALYDPNFNVNSTSCPGEVEWISFGSFNVTGANRSPNPIYLKYGTLSSITYPTGGKTVFEFEPHKYSYANNSAVTKIVEDGPQLYLNGNGSQLQDTYQLKANVTLFPRFIFQFEVTCWDPNTRLPMACHLTGAQVNADKFQGNSFAIYNANNEEVLAVKWELGDGGFWIYRKGMVDTNIGKLMPDASGFITRQIEDFKLYSDDYTLKITKNPNCNTDVFGWLYYNKEITINLNDPNEAVIAGGLRVWKIENFDENNNSVGFKTYEYGHGVLLDKPRYYTYVYMYPETSPLKEPSWFQYCGPQGPGHNGLYGVDSTPFIELSCGSYTSVGSTQGSPIGYVEVTEKTDGNGSIKYTYTTGIDYPDNGFDVSNTVSYLFWDGFGPESLTTWKHYKFNDVVPWPFVSQDNLDRKRGFLRNVLITDNLGHSKQIKESTPIISDSNPVYGLRLMTLRPEIDWLYSIYKYSSGFVNVASSSETLTDLDNNISISTSTSYDYQSNYHKQLTRQTTTNSDGMIFTTEYRYADDYTNITDPNHVITKMKASNLHMGGIPLETRKYKNESLIDGTILNYSVYSKAGGGSFVAPKSSYSLIGTTGSQWSLDPTNPSLANFKKEVELFYDGYINLSTATSVDQVNTTFLWEDNKSFPVARVVHAPIPTELFYNSFEKNGTMGDATNPAKTGKRYWNSGTFSFSGNVSFTPANPSALKMSYWYWANNQWNFSGIVNFQNSINIGSRLDEIRVHPTGAQMTTYTYDEGSRVSSITDINGVITSYKYDKLGRLESVIDKNNNIVQSTQYHFKGQN